MHQPYRMALVSRTQKSTHLSVWGKVRADSSTFSLYSTSASHLQNPLHVIFTSSTYGLTYSQVPGMLEILADLTPQTQPGLLGICLSGAGPTILALATENFEVSYARNMFPW